MKITLMISLVLMVIATLPVAPSVAVMVVDTDGLEPTERSRLVDRTLSAIESETGRRATLDAFATTPALARNNTGATTVLVVSALAGAELIRLTIERHEIGRAVARAQFDLLRRDDPWGVLVDSAVHALFPFDRPAAVATEPALVVSDHQTGRVLAWSGIGVSALLVGVAIVLRVMAESKRREAEDENNELVGDESHRLGLVSNIGFGAAAAIVSGSVVYLLTIP